MSKSKNYQKFISATVATAVVASTAATVVPYNVEAASFKDVVKGTYFYDAVSTLSGQGVVNGFKDGTFKPYENATRGQAAALIARALKLDGATVKDPGFKDVKKEAYYYKSVAALANAGIINGVTKDSYEPNRLVTRAEMAKMIANAFKLKENKTSASKFKDVPANSWYAGFVGALAENGITVGKTATSFDPSNKVNRAQVATFIYRAREKQAITNVVGAVTDSSVTINGKSYKIADSLKGLFNAANATVLKDARIAFDQSNGTITGVKGLEITASGKAAAAGQSEQSGHLVLDGKGAVVNGSVTINGDYVSVKNLTVKGDFTIGSSVKNSFFSDKLVVEGKTIIPEGVNTASVKAAATKKVIIIFSNSTLKIVEVSKKDVSIETKGSTKVTEITVSSNASISADSTSSIPKVTLQDGVINVEINGAVGNLTIISKEPITISGNATIEKVQINQSGAVTLNTTGEIKQIESKNKDAQITIKEGTKVGNVIVPAGSDVKDIIQNYDQVKRILQRLVE